MLQTYDRLSRGEKCDCPAQCIQKWDRQPHRPIRRDRKMKQGEESGSK